MGGEEAEAVRMGNSFEILVCERKEIGRPYLKGEFFLDLNEVNSLVKKAAIKIDRMLTACLLHTMWGWSCLRKEEDHLTLLIQKRMRKVIQ